MNKIACYNCKKITATVDKFVNHKLTGKLFVENLKVKVCEQCGMVCAVFGSESRKIQNTITDFKKTRPTLDELIQANPDLDSTKWVEHLTDIGNKDICHCKKEEATINCNFLLSDYLYDEHDLNEWNAR